MKHRLVFSVEKMNVHNICLQASRATIHACIAWYNPLLKIFSKCNESVIGLRLSYRENLSQFGARRVCFVQGVCTLLGGSWLQCFPLISNSSSGIQTELVNSLCLIDRELFQKQKKTVELARSRPPPFFPIEKCVLPRYQKAFVAATTEDNHKCPTCHQSRATALAFLKINPFPVASSQSRQRTRNSRRSSHGAALPQCTPRCMF